MDTTIKKINFDEKNICNHCRDYEQRIRTEIYREPIRTKKLNFLIDKIKKDGQNKKYDCIIGMSGGVDSSYVAYLTKEFKLKPLAVHLDNGWNTELAVENIRKIINNLNIDLHTHVIDWNEFKDLQIAFIKSSIENLEIPTDHAINSILYKMSEKYKLKYILSGSNLSSEGLNNPQGGTSLDYRLIKDIHRIYGIKNNLKSYPFMSIWNMAYKIFVKKIKYIPILNYVNYDKEDAIKLLEKKFEWKRYGGKHYESIFTRFFQGYILPKKYNYDKRKVHLSNLIMSKQIDRNKALNELKKSTYPNEELLKEDMDFFLKKLNFSKIEFDKIMNSKPKEPTDFNSYEKFFEKFKLLKAKIKKYAKKDN